MAAGRPSQLENRNFLSPVGFKFNLKRSPGVAFLCNSANIPDISLGEATQATYLRDIPTPGDKIQFGDLSLRFLVDEDLKNYMEIQHWIRGLGYPESVQEFRDLDAGGQIPKQNYGQKMQDIYSDGTLQIQSILHVEMGYLMTLRVDYLCLSLNLSPTSLEVFQDQS